jgi:hypothetical protein
LIVAKQARPPALKFWGFHELAASPPSLAGRLEAWRQSGSFAGLILDIEKAASPIYA